MAAQDTRAPQRTSRSRALPRPDPGTWIFLAVAGLHELAPAARTAWRELLPRLPAGGPYALLLAGVLFGVAFRHLRLSAWSLLLAVALWVRELPAPDPSRSWTLAVLLLAANLAWIGAWPPRSRLGWRALGGLLLIAAQAAAVARWSPQAHALADRIAEATGGAGATWAGGAILLGLAPWIVRAIAGGAGLPATVLWACASTGLALVATGEDRPELHRWLAAVLALTALAEASYRLAYVDELTGLPGRRALVDALSRLRGDYALGVVDVDRFKSVNDRHGHEVGDQVLRRVASELRTVTGATAYRLGGEEFALVFPRAPADAEEALERVRRQIAERRFTVRGADRPRRRPAGAKPGSRGSFTVRQQRRITVSIGLAVPTARERRPEEVLRRADAALYRAKRAGRNRLVVAGRRSGGS